MPAETSSRVTFCERKTPAREALAPMITLDEGQRAALFAALVSCEPMETSISEARRAHEPRSRNWPGPSGYAISAGRFGQCDQIKPQAPGSWKRKICSGIPHDQRVVARNQERYPSREAGAIGASEKPGIARRARTGRRTARTEHGSACNPPSVQHAPWARTWRMDRRRCLNQHR